VKVIQDNLEYDEQNHCWRTGYPWLVEPSSLPDNYSAALATFSRYRTNFISRQ
jgi:hypothetical protein